MILRVSPTSRTGTESRHDAMVFSSLRVVHQQAWGPSNVELFHELGSIVPKAFAFYWNEFVLYVFLDLCIGIRTRIHCFAAESALKPKILIYRLVGFPGQFYRCVKISLPIYLGHCKTPFECG